MGVYTYINAFAIALQASSTLKTFCSNKWGKTCLIQIDENPNAPLRLEDAPFLILRAYPSSELGPVSDELQFPILMTAAIIEKINDADPTLPTITTARSTSANGLQAWGRTQDAEDLLAAAITIIKATSLTSAIVKTISEESNGWMFYPLQTAEAILNVGESNTF